MAGREEYEFVIKHGPYDGQRVIEVGACNDYSQTYRNNMCAREYIGVDMRHGKYVQIVHNLDEPLDIEPAHTVMCMSVLEHAQRPHLVAKHTAQLVAAHGLLVLSVPFVWRVHEHPNDYWRFTPEAVKFLFPGFKWIEEAVHPPRVRLDKHSEEKHIMLFFAGRKE